ncbi:MAG: PAS domain-containing protein [Verrucomicrobiales bacterium]|nr:PAS domain-containing protein [Verrucomicrobiales bacterium]
MPPSVLHNVIHPKVPPPQNGGGGVVAPALVAGQDGGELLSMVVEHAPVAIAVFDREMRYLLANRQWVTEFNLEAMGPLVGRVQYEVFPALHHGWRQVYERAMQGHVVRSDRDLIAGPDGQPVVFRWEVRPWRDGNDVQVAGIMVTCDKFAPVVLPAEAVEDTEATAANFAPTPPTVAEGAPTPGFDEWSVPVVLLDSTGVVQQANPSAMQLCLARGIQERQSFFWDAFACGREIAANRKAMLTSLAKIHLPGNTGSETVLLRAVEGTTSENPPLRWMLIRQKGGQNVVAIGLGNVVESAPIAKAGIQLTPPAMTSIPVAPAADALELRRLQEQLARTQQELRTMEEAERGFVRRENRQRSVLEVLPCGLLVLDEHATVVFQNSHLAKMFGRAIERHESVEAWLSGACRDAEHREEVTATWREYVWRRQIIRTVSLANAEGMMKEVEMHPAGLAGGGLVISFRDVTDSRRTGDQLVATEAKFRSMIAGCPMGVVLVDKTGTIFEVNHAAEDLLGQPKSELRRMPFDELLDEESIAARKEALRELRMKSGDSSAHLTVRLAEGSPESEPLRLSVNQVLNGAGEPHCTIHFLERDLPPVVPVVESMQESAGTGLEADVPISTEAEADLDVWEPLLATNATGRVVSWHSAAEAMTGYAGEDVIGHLLHAFFSPTDPAEFYEVLEELTASGEESLWPFYGHQGLQGTCLVRSISEGDSPLAVRIEVFLSSIKVAESPTASDLSEGTVLRPDQRWSLLDLPRERLLLSETHHRIKNHLQIISSLLNLQAQSLSDADARAALRASQMRVRSIAALHEHLHLLAIGQTESFAEFATHLVGHLRECYGVSEDRVAVDLDFQAGALHPEWLMPLALTLSETLSNTFKHAFPNDASGRVSVTLRMTETSGELTVADDGCGLPPEISQGDGWGLGLKILSVFAEQMRGQLIVNSPQNGKTEIKLRFSIAFADN